jgi:hypothetical protein
VSTTFTQAGISTAQIRKDITHQPYTEKLRYKWSNCLQIWISIVHLVKQVVLWSRYIFFCLILIGEPFTNRNISCTKAFGICPSPRATGGDGTYDLSTTRQDSHRYATRWGYNIINNIHVFHGVPVNDHYVWFCSTIFIFIPIIYSNANLFGWLWRFMILLFK